MSHVTRLRTKITDRALLRATLEELGYTVWEAGNVAFYEGGRKRREFCDLMVSAVPPPAMSSRHSRRQAANTPTPVGELICFQKKGAQYEVFADWVDVGISQTQFMNAVMQRYALRLARQKIESQGYKVKLQVEQQDQSVSVLLTRDHTTPSDTKPREQQIECEIKDGQVSIITRGFQGKACFEATRELESALGNDILQQDWTPEGFFGQGILEPAKEREYALVAATQARKPNVRPRQEYVHGEPIPDGKAEAKPRQEYNYGEPKEETPRPEGFTPR
jgi:hypothetical protein